MARVQLRECGDCERTIGPTERRWDHVTQGGLKIRSFCEECMLEQVSDYAARTIHGMLDGVVKVRVIGQVAEDGAPSTPERSEP
jgi:hypothetical protein